MLIFLLLFRLNWKLLDLDPEGQRRMKEEEGVDLALPLPYEPLKLQD